MHISEKSQRAFGERLKFWKRAKTDDNLTILNEEVKKNYFLKKKREEDDMKIFSEDFDKFKN